MAAQFDTAEIFSTSSGDTELVWRSVEQEKLWKEREQALYRRKASIPNPLFDNNESPMAPLRQSTESEPLTESTIPASLEMASDPDSFAGSTQPVDEQPTTAGLLSPNFVDVTQTWKSLSSLTQSFISTASASTSNVFSSIPTRFPGFGSSSGTTSPVKVLSNPTSPSPLSELPSTGEDGLGVLTSEMQPPMSQRLTKAQKRLSRMEKVPEYLPPPPQVDVGAWADVDDEKDSPLVVPELEDVPALFTDIDPVVDSPPVFDPVADLWLRESLQREEEDEEEDEEEEIEEIRRDSVISSTPATRDSTPVVSNSSTARSSEVQPESRNSKVEGSGGLVPRPVNLAWSKPSRRSSMPVADGHESKIEELAPDDPRIAEFSTESTVTFYQGFRAVYPTMTKKSQSQLQRSASDNRSTIKSLNPATALLNFYSGKLPFPSRNNDDYLGGRSKSFLGLGLGGAGTVARNRSSLDSDRGSDEGAVAYTNRSSWDGGSGRPLPYTARAQAVSITNIARLFAELLNQRDAVLDESEKLESQRNMVTSELRQVQDLLTELTKRRSDLEDELRNIAEREEKVSELLADFESRLSNISEETIRTEKRIRSIKADSTVMEIEAPPEIPPDTCIMTLYGHSDSIECLDFDGAYGTLVTGSADRTVRVWDLSSYRCHAELSGHTGWIRAVQLHRSFVVSGSGDNTLRMWDITRLPPLPNSALTPDMAPSIPYCRLDARREQPLEEDDMKDLVVGEGEGDSLVLRKNDNSTNVCVRVFRGHTGAVSCLQFDDQWLLSGSVDKTIRQWDMPTGKELLCLRSEKWLEADEMSRVDVFLLGETRDPIGFAQGLSFATAALGKPASPIATSPIADSEKTEVDGVVGEAGSESPVPATNGDAGVPPGKLTIQASPVVSIANSSPSFRVENAGGHVGALQYWQHALAAGYGDGVVRLWDLRTGKSHRQLRSTNGHYQPITSLKFDSNYIATGSSDKTIKIWDIRKGDVTDTIRFSHAVNDLHMDPFRIMAATGSRDVYVYNRSSSLTRTLQGHTKAVRSLKCAEEVLISAGMDSCARIWKL